MLRAGLTDCEIEVMGYRRVLSLVGGRYFADRTRNIEYGPMAGFFDPRGELDPALCEYFRGFSQVVSYIYDPDGLFGGNLARAGVEQILPVSPIVDPAGPHASVQLAAPLAALGLGEIPAHAVLRLSDTDLETGRRLAAPLPRPFCVLHPGSGSPSKNWDPSNWAGVVEGLVASGRIRSVAVVLGEADELPGAALRGRMDAWPAWFFSGLELIELAGLIHHAGVFLGHDSGISHLAAATGTDCYLVYGPTNPDVWAPAHPGVRVIRAPGGDLGRLGVESVLAGVREFLGKVGP